MSTPRFLQVWTSAGSSYVPTSSIGRIDPAGSDGYCSAYDQSGRRLGSIDSRTADDVMRITIPNTTSAAVVQVWRNEEGGICYRWLPIIGWSIKPGYGSELNDPITPTSDPRGAWFYDFGSEVRSGRYVSRDDDSCDILEEAADAALARERTVPD